MAGIRTLVVDLLKAAAPVAALVDARVYPVSAPDAPDYPLVVVHKASGVGEYDLDGDVGVEDARVQLDCYAIGQDACDELSKAVRTFLSGFKGGGDTSIPCAIQACMCINDFDLNETATERSGPRLRRKVLEFRIWNREV